MRASAQKGFFSELGETRSDFVAAFKQIPLAVRLAFQDVLTRYRGSVLGPWWITITMCALVLGIGINYASLFHVAVRDLLPYVAFGLVSWSFISTCIAEGGESFVAAGAILRQSALPLPLFVLRSVIRNYVNLLHHLVIVVAVMAWFQIFPGLGVLLVFVGLALVTLNLSWMCLILATISARFRDVPQIVAAVLQFLFFLSPVFWKPTAEMQNSVFVYANPFYQMVQALRSPLLTGSLSIFGLEYLSLIAFLGWSISLAIYNLTRRRVVHYL